MPDKAPAYVSSRSADEILSAIRPTKIKSEAMRSLNIFLDELLWLVLHAARSLATNRLKAGLLQIMPSALGKDAILEAEVELRTYKMRSPTPVMDEPGVKQTDFPLQPTFELLRQKCEAYCTLGDVEEDVAVESALTEKMVNAGPGSPTAEQVAPAALYLTAILEHVCEHVLNNVGQVVARDSSRGTAYSQDVYVALCEDAAVYPLFKTMKVHEHIETQSKAFKPSHGGSSSISGGSRTKSISRIRQAEDVPQARKMSLPTTALESPSTNPPSSFTRRPSADAVVGNSAPPVTRSLSGTTLPSSNKSSLERTRSSLERITGKRSTDGHTTGRTNEKNARGIKIFGKGSGRTSSEDGPASHMAPFPSTPNQATPDERSASSLSDGTRRAMVAFQQGSMIESDGGDDSDGPFSQDFDELMRSGATMKVSLTPDRLKTFETFAKRKNQISTRATPQGSPSYSAVPSLPTSTDMTLSQRVAPNRREHDAILEADEGSRSRTQSLAQLLDDEPKIPPIPAQPAPPPQQTGRSRSHTESSSTRPSIGTKPGLSSGPSILRKASFNSASREREKSSPDSTPPNEQNRTRKVSEAPKLATLPGTPSRRKGPAQRQESMDLDDIINEPVAPRNRSGALAPKPAHQTANTRDLIDFLSEGPPEPYQAPRSASSGAIEPTNGKPSKQSSGRWFRRLVGGSSSSTERAGVVPDVPDMARTLGKQKSATNIRGASASSGFGSSPTTQGKVPPSPALSLDTALQPLSPVTLVRKVSPNRKAVPAWNPDENAAESASVPHSPPALVSAMSTPEPPHHKPLRSEIDVFTAPSAPVSRPRPAELGPSASPISSKSASLKRVPVPRLEPDVSELGIKVPERRRQEKEEPRAEKAQDAHSGGVVVPTVVDDDKVRRIQTGSPVPPSGTTGITPAQAAELRTALAHATTADECRVLLDLVLGQWGLGRPTPEPSAVPPLSAGCSEFDDSDEAMAVDMLLGEGSMRPERHWPLTPKDSLPKLHEARVVSVRSSE